MHKYAVYYDINKRPTDKDSIEFIEKATTLINDHRSAESPKRRKRDVIDIDDELESWIGFANSREWDIRTSNQFLTTFDHAIQDHDMEADYTYFCRELDDGYRIGMDVTTVAKPGVVTNATYCMSSPSLEWDLKVNWGDWHDVVKPSKVKLYYYNEDKHLATRCVHEYEIKQVLPPGFKGTDKEESCMVLKQCKLCEDINYSRVWEEE
jgi:hypothetical protein